MEKNEYVCSLVRGNMEHFRIYFPIHARSGQNIDLTHTVYHDLN